MSDIWERYRKLEQNRMHKQHEFMAIYDRDVYYPQLTALREECAELSVNSRYANTKSEYYEGFNEAFVYVGIKIKQHFGVKE